MPVEVAIIAAMRREIWPLVKNWKRRPIGVRHVEAFESGGVLVICGGIGERAARVAAELAFGVARPGVVISAGFAGALEPGLSAGSSFVPAKVIDAQSGRTYQAYTGSGTLVSVAAMATTADKRRLARQFDASAVDMEAAAVAEVASARGAAFAAVKGISDAAEFAMPPTAEFVDDAGQFHTARFVLSNVVRPARWAGVARLAVSSSRASRELCRALAHLIEKRKAEISDAVTRG